MDRRVWWRCAHGHVWDAVIAVRTAKDAGCPICREAAKPRKKWVKKRKRGRVPILI